MAKNCNQSRRCRQQSVANELNYVFSYTFSYHGVLLPKDLCVCVLRHIIKYLREEPGLENRCVAVVARVWHAVTSALKANSNNNSKICKLHL